MDFWLLISLISCALMTGLIWIVQLVHYPSFKYIDENEFVSFHNFHTFSITLFVFPAMLAELVSGIYLFIREPQDVLIIASTVMVVLLWLSTMFISVPIHNSLTHTKNINQINKLVSTNWIRTFLWTGRLIVLGVVALRGEA